MSCGLTCLSLFWPKACTSCSGCASTMTQPLHSWLRQEQVNIGRSVEALRHGAINTWLDAELAEVDLDQPELKHRSPGQRSLKPPIYQFFRWAIRRRRA